MTRSLFCLLAVLALFAVFSTAQDSNRCPYCVDKTCGPDGVGGSCGTCPVGQRCERGTCICDRGCIARECGPDNCGTTCGICLPGQTCVNGICTGACTPQCVRDDGSFRTCGWDRCGGCCGDCPEGFRCRDGTCECYPDCEEKHCGPDGCGGTCGTCVGDDAVCQGDNDEFPGQCYEICFRCGDGICNENEASTTLRAIQTGGEYCPQDCGSVSGIISLAVGQKDQLNGIQIDMFDLNPFLNDREMAGREAETVFSDDKGSFAFHSVTLPGGDMGQEKRVYFRLRGTTSDRTTGDIIPLMDLWWNFALINSPDLNQSPQFYFFMTPFFTDSDALFRMILSWGNLLSDRASTIPDVDMFIAGPVDSTTMAAENPAFRNGIVNFANKDYKSETSSTVLPFAQVVADSAQGVGPEVIDVLKDVRIGAPEQTIGLSRDYPEAANAVNRLEFWIDRPNSNSNQDNAFSTLSDTNSFVVVYRGSSVNPTVINEQLFFGDYDQAPAYMFGFYNRDPFNEVPADAAAWHVFNLAWSGYSSAGANVGTTNVFEFVDIPDNVKYATDDFIFAPTKTIPCSHTTANGVPGNLAYCPYTIEYPVKK